MPFLVTLGDCPARSPAALEDAIDAGRAAGDDVGIEHHEGQPAIAFERVWRAKMQMRSFSSSVSQWSRGTQALCSLTLPKRCFQSWNLLVPMPIQGRKRPTGMSVLSLQARTKSTTVVAGVVGNPAAGQISPRLFFSWVCSSMSSARTSFLRVSLASSCSIFWSLASSTALDLRPLSKASMAVLEELLEPAIELVGVDVEFIAQVGDGNLVDEVPLEDGDLLGAGEMTTLACSW